MLLSYLYRGHPEKSDIEDTVSDEARQVESQEVEVETYNTENKLVNVIFELIQKNTPKIRTRHQYKQCAFSSVYYTELIKT